MKQTQYSVGTVSSFTRLTALILVFTAASLSPLGLRSVLASTATWTGAASGNWADANWGGGSGTGGAPATSGDSLIFTSTTGVGGTMLTDNLMTPATYSIGGITFSSGAAAFIITSATAGVNGFTLTGNITNSSTSLETINDAITTTAVRTVTLTAGGGNVALGGNITGSGGLTTSGSGTLTLSGADSFTGAITVGTTTELTFGASNVLTSNSNSLTMSSGGLTNILDLAGHSETFGTLSSSTTSDQGGIITDSSVTTGTLTLNEGSNTGNIFGGTRFTGSLALTIRGNNLSNGTGDNLQMIDANNSFTGGLTLQSTGAALSFSNLAVAGGLTGVSTEGLRFNSGAAIGTGQVTLDNGQLFAISGASTITNNILVTTNGGVIHNENNGAVYSGSLASSGSTNLVINSNSGGSNTLNFTGADSGFSGTWIIDTTNIGGIHLNNSAVGNSNTDILWYGDGTNGGKGQLQLTGTASATYTFGEINNYSTIASGTASGLVENVSASTTTTLTLGDANTTAASYDGLLENGSGTLALTKNNSNTQTLAAAETYTGATTINGGVLQIASNGSLAAGSTVGINSGGTLTANGTVAGAVNVNGGGFLGGTGTVSGLVTLAAGSTNPTAGAISLVNGVGTLTLSNAAGLTLGGAAGSYSILDLAANASLADVVALGLNALTVNAGGADITITSLGIASGKTYNLLTYASGAGAGFTTGSGATVGDLTLTDPNLAFGVTGSLNVTGTAVQLVTSGAAAPGTAYWSGTAGAMWSGTNAGGGNFTTDAAGTTQVQAYPGSTTAVIFAASNATNFTETLGAGFDIGSLTFSGANAVTINSDGNTLTVESGGLTVQSGAGAVSIGANIAGAGGVTNAGTLTLSGANTFSGGTVTTGTLTLGSSTALGSSSGTLAVNGGLLDLNGNNQTVGSLSGSSGAIITDNSSSTNSTLTVGGALGLSSTYAGALNNGSNGKTLALTKSGFGTLALTGSNNYSGATLVTGGILQLGNAYAMGTSAATVDNGSTLDLDGQTIANGVTLTGTGFGGGGALINSNTGTPAEILGNIPNGSFTVGGAGTISLTQLNQANSGAAYTVTAAGPGTLIFTGSTLNYLMALAVNGGTVILSKTTSNWAIDRGATLTSGTLEIGASGQQFGYGTGLTENGGDFDLEGYNVGMDFLFGTGGIVTNSGATEATLTIGTTQSTTYSSGTYGGELEDGVSQLALVKTGTSELTLTGSSNFSGGTTITGGILQTANAYALGNSSASSLTVNGATLDMDGNSVSVGALTGNSTALITSTTAGAVTLTTVTGSNTTYAGAIQNGNGMIALVKGGSGALTLSNTNSSFSGGTTIKNGTIIQTAAGALGSGAITLGDGSTSNPATLEGAGSSTIANTNPITIAAGGSGAYTIENTTGSDYDFSGNIALNNPVTLETTANGALFASGTITGSSNITVSGAGTTSKFVEFSANNSSTWTGNLLITDGGDWKSGNASALGVSNTVVMDSTATFDNGVQSMTIAGLQDGTITTGASSVILAGGGTTLSLGGSGSYSFSGDISSSGGIALTGGGSQTLSGASVYAGATAVTNGTLIVSGSLSGTDSVSVGATGHLEVDGLVNNSATINVTGGELSGVGSVGPVDVNSDGDLAPGLTAGSTAAGALTSGSVTFLDTASAFSIRLGVVTGTDGDQLIVSSGAIALNDTPLQLTIGSALNNSANLDKYYTIIYGGAGATGTGSDLFSYDGSAIADDGLFTTPGGYTFEVIYATDGIGSDDIGTGNNVELQLIAVPEPGTWGMVMGGAGMLLAFQRIRRRKL
jgi:autotransporter-associated beta strand protein